MSRVVVDTVVFVRALLYQRSICARLLFAPHTRFQLIASPPILQEMNDVLHRPSLRRKFGATRGWNLEAVFEILADAEIVEPDPIPPTCRDPKDDKFLAAALAGRAHYLISEDQDLLVLEQFGETRIVRPVSFLQLSSG